MTTLCWAATLLPFPRRREGFPNAIGCVWGPSPRTPRLYWTPACSGVTDEAPAIVLLGALRQVFQVCEVLVTTGGLFVALEMFEVD